MGEYGDLIGELSGGEHAAPAHYYGKYRALVIDNLDPEQAGRLKVRVPEVLGDQELWAVPSWPPGSTPEQHQLPEVGTEVWVEFEAGDLYRPIWDGLLH